MSHEIYQAAVELREGERPLPPLNRILHDFTHGFPGIPKHTDPRHVRAEHEAHHRARAPGGGIVHPHRVAEPARSQADLRFIATGERSGSKRRKQ